MENTTVTSLPDKSRVRHDGAKQVRVYGVKYCRRGGGYQGYWRCRHSRHRRLSNDKTPNSLLQSLRRSCPASLQPMDRGPRVTASSLHAELGVKLVDMDKVQLHPTGLIDPKAPQTRPNTLARSARVGGRRPAKQEG
ncbi:hypothetical protein TcBrA4_0099050 [Trypanosoma cruzi]|nr:hypothetical protein TcBrA4_0099050 [Trypanosoma cruzi]